MDDVKYVVGVDDTDIVKTLLNHKKLVKEIAAVEKQYKFLDKQIEKKKISLFDYARAVQQVDQRVAKLNGVLAGGSKAVNDHATKVVQAGNKMNKFGMISQQVGYQVGDFFVQVQSGQNAMVAFAQQATQLAGLIPGVGGAVIGIGLAAGTFGYQMYKSSQGIKDADEALKDLKETIDGFSSASVSLEKALASPINNSNKALVSYLKNLKAARAAQTRKDVRVEIGGIIQPYVEDKKEAQNRLALRGRATLTGAARQAELQKFAEAKLISDTLAFATKGPAKDLGKNLVEAMEALRASGKLSTELEGTLTRLLENSGLRAQVEKDLIALVKEQTEEQQKAEKIKDEAFQKSTKQNILENEITSGLKSQIAYQAIVAKYGENSVKGKQELAKLARDEYEQEKYASGLRVEQVDRLMDVYDELIKVTGEAEAFTSETELTRQKLLEIDNIIKAISGSISSLEMSAIGDAARLAALKAGKSIEEARIAGQVAGKVANQQALFDAASVSSLPDGAKRAAEEAHQRQIELLRQQGATAAEIQRLEDKLRESKKKGKEDPAIKMLQEIDRRKVLIGLTEEQAKRQELVYQTEDKLGEFREKYGNDFINNIVKQTMALDEQQKVLDKARGQQKEIAGVISSSFGDAFMSIVDGTSSVKDAFKNMASYVVKELFRIIVVQQMVNALAGALTGTSAAPTSVPAPLPRPTVNANGNAFYGGNVIPFAKGGVVGSPMMFPMAGGNTGLMGEAGPEAIMPLKRGKGGKLGVVAENSGNVVINQSFNFSANGDESVKKIIAQAAPQIAQMTKTSIINDRRRGGSTKAAFG